MRDARVDLNAKDDKQNSALHLAASHGHADVVAALLADDVRGRLDVDATINRCLGLRMARFIVGSVALS